MQEVMRETAGWSELGFSPGLTAIIQFGWDTTQETGIGLHYSRTAFTGVQDIHDQRTS